MKKRSFMGPWEIMQTPYDSRVADSASIEFFFHSQVRHLLHTRLAAKRVFISVLGKSWLSDRQTAGYAGNFHRDPQKARRSTRRRTSRGDQRLTPSPIGDIILGEQPSFEVSLYIRL